MMTRLIKSSSLLGWGLVLVFGATLVIAGEKNTSKSDSKDGSETVELFKAMENGQIDVKLVQKSSLQGTVIIENKTKKPLSIKLPEVFAGVPVLAQMGGGGGGGGGGGRNSSGSRSSGSSSGNQSTGGGMMGGMGGGMGMYNIAPERVGQFKVSTVCLEHGKEEPQSTVAYTVKPIETVTEKPAVHELLKMLNSDDVDQRSLQAAAWYLENNLSWKDLASKQINRVSGNSQPYFSQQEIQKAMVLVTSANQKILEKEEKASKNDKKDSFSNKK